MGKALVTATSIAASHGSRACGYRVRDGATCRYTTTAKTGSSAPAGAAFRASNAHDLQALPRKVTSCGAEDQARELHFPRVEGRPQSTSCSYLPGLAARAEVGPDLENDCAMKGSPTARLLELIRELEQEGLL